MIVLCCHASAILELVEEALDPVAHGVEGTINGILHAAVLLGRDFGSAATVSNLVPDYVAIVASVAQQGLGVGVMRPASGRQRQCCHAPPPTSAGAQLEDPQRWSGRGFWS